MLLSQLRTFRSAGAALALTLAASLLSAACGQDGIVAATSSGTAGSAGTTGGAGGAGGSGGAGAGGAGGAEIPQALKILDWNLHNFFDTQDDPAISNVDEMVLSMAQYNEKVQQVSAVVKEMNPDIAVFPEIENEAILKDLNKALGGAYTTAITQTNDFRGLDIGVLSKVPLDKVVSHATDMFKRLDLVGGQLYKYSRDAVEVHLTYNTRQVVLFGVHYRSKGDGSPETDDKDKRMAEAQHTRALADEVMKADPNTAVLILGDYNDLPGSPPVSWTLLGDPKSSPKVTFVSAADNVAQADRYTFVYNGTKELIDHQIMNPIMSKLLDPAGVVIRHGADVEAASDHHPLMATYQIQ